MAEKSANFDEMMVAMDVVDTLRHQEKLALKELGAAERRKALIEKLRRIYAEQGIEVSDAILEEGVRALEEERFEFKPEGSAFGRFLATLYVKRGTFLKTLLVALGIGAGGYGLYYGAYLYPKAHQAQRLKEESLKRFRAIVALAKEKRATQKAQALMQQVKAATASGDTAAAKAAEAALERLYARLSQAYTLRIVQAPGVRSGIWRIPPKNPRGKNYYLIVEAIDQNGKTLSLEIENEENGKRETVARWGIRVPRSVYEAVRADKMADGIVDKRIVGKKERGRLAPTYTIPVVGGKITRW